MESRECRCCHGFFPADNKHFYNLNGALHPNCITCCKISRSLEAVRKRDKKTKLSLRQLVRARSLGLAPDQIEGVLLVEVFRNDRGVCYICKTWVKPGQASMDHRVPLSRGGVHLYSNVRLTHFKCNLRKGSKLHSA